jgi:hypothetical protein
MEHQTARGTTTGPAKPLGSRGAQVADTVGRGALESRASGASNTGFFYYLRALRGAGKGSHGGATALALAVTVEASVCTIWTEYGREQPGEPSVSI